MTTTTPNIIALSREFCKLAGICNHSEGVWVSSNGWTCDKCGQNGKNDFRETDFTDAREVLKVMRKRDDYAEFVDKIGCRHAFIPFIKEYLILDTTGLLLQEAVKFLEERK